MLVNKSGGRLVIGRINVKSGETLPGIPYTADERKGIEKLVKKGYIVEVVDAPEEAEKPEPTKAEPVKKAEEKKSEPKKAEPKKAEPVVEEKKAEPVSVEAAVEEPKAEPAYAKFSRRKKKSVTTEDGGSADS